MYIYLRLCRLCLNTETEYSSCTGGVRRMCSAVPLYTLRRFIVQTQSMQRQ